MNYLDIEQEMSKKGLVLLYGEEELLMDEIIQTFIKRWTKKEVRDFNLLRLPAGAKEDQVLDAAMTLPLMDNHKFVLVKDVGAFIDQNPISKDFLDQLKDLPEGLVLLFRQGEKPVDKRTRLYKWIKKHGACIDCKPLNRMETIEYLKRISKEYKVKVDQGSYGYFIDLMGYLKKDVSLADVRLEWEKLLSACQSIPLDQKSINYFTSYQDQVNIFAFTDAFTQRKPKATFQALNKLFDQDMDVYQIIAMLNRQVAQVLRGEILFAQGYTEGALKDRMKVHPFVAKKLARNRGHYRVEELEKILDALVDLDQTMKSSSLDPRALLETRLLAFMAK